LELARAFDRHPGLPGLVFSNHHQEGHKMSQVNINRVVLTGNLTADPELRNLQSGTSVCKLRVACNTRRKDSASGNWTDKPNYFDVTVWGNLGETVAKYTAKGRPVAIDGRLEWREWENDGAKRQAIEIIADSVQFLGSQPSNGSSEAAS
jgi:single-strand DNA-binding protein